MEWLELGKIKQREKQLKSWEQQDHRHGKKNVCRLEWRGQTSWSTGLTCGSWGEVRQANCRRFWVPAHSPGRQKACHFFSKCRESCWESYDGLRKHSLHDLNSLSDTHLRNLMRTMSLKTLRRGARICAFIQIFSTVLALPEKNGTR